MRAAVLRAYGEDLAIEEVPRPACPEDGVVLKVLACGVCRSDWHGWRGEHPRVRPGQIPGHEYCGIVEEAGPRSGWKPGDRVIAPFLLACGNCPSCREGNQTVCPDQRLPGFVEPGAFAEYVAVPLAHNLTRLPEGMSPTLAAGMGCRVTTAWHALTGRAQVRPGEWVAVHGTGGVGMAAVALGHAMGARMIAVDIVPEKLEMARRMGAEAALDAGAGDVAQAIRDITGGGAHVSLEALGIEATARASIACLRPLGRHVQVGMPVGSTADMTLPMNLVYTGQLALYGTRGMPSWRYPSLFAFLETTGLDLMPLIGREIPLSAASAALRAMNGPTPPGVDVITDFTA
ncbi:MAG: alcohol dehydrogenase [Alphaproteobacteria bacterium]|nr:MAG: alcohol dehydrogenase [Alphaproteobacteria bacterium]